MSEVEAITKATMYCRRCSYVLDGLPSRRCPECGEEFDPYDAGTYRTRPRRRWWPWWIGAVALVCVAGVVAWNAWSSNRLAPGTVRMTFDPDWVGKGETSWSRLGPLMGGERDMAFCRLKLGERFPAQLADGTTAFRVHMVEGDDDQLTVDVEAPNGTKQRLKLVRDKEVAFTVDGERYSLRYPSVTVAATQPVSTNAATIIVTHPPLQ